MGSHIEDVGSKLNTLLKKTYDAEKKCLIAAFYDEDLDNIDLPHTTSINLTQQKNIIQSNLETVKAMADVI